MNELLRREVIKYVHRRRPSRGMLTGELAKGPSHRDKHPDWMKVKAFEGRSWVQLGIHERKYLLRKLVPAMLASGILRLVEVFPNVPVVRQQAQFRLELGSVLDMMAAVVD